MTAAARTRPATSDDAVAAGRKAEAADDGASSIETWRGPLPGRTWPQVTNSFAFDFVSCVVQSTCSASGNAVAAGFGVPSSKKSPDCQSPYSRLPFAASAAETLVSGGGPGGTGEPDPRLAWARTLPRYAAAIRRDREEALEQLGMLRA